MKNYSVEGVKELPSGRHILVQGGNFTGLNSAKSYAKQLVKDEEAFEAVVLDNYANDEHAEVIYMVNSEGSFDITAGDLHRVDWADTFGLNY